MSLPEILAPVGDWNMLRAAVHNGADAVYLGMPGFNARGRAATLEIPELAAMIDYSHLYGVRVLLAFNVLIFERELPDVVNLLTDVLPLRPDALIVQDIGLVRLIKFMAPEQVVHASTQMTITSSEAIVLTEELDIKRYVLGREVSIPEMTDIRQKTDKELEVFVHGALCVSYSGQCLTSESMGGRSANRGQCAQSCRLEYDLVVDGETRPMGAKRHLVSPQDLSGLSDIPKLTELGINSFKIEGRLKSPAYVASTVRAYRARSRGELLDGSVDASERQLARIYSRGFFSGWLNGVDHQRLVNARLSSHHGLRLGSVLSVSKDRLIIQSIEPLSPGEGLVFIDPDTDAKIGSTIFKANPLHKGQWELSFGREFALSDVSVGMWVYVNSSPALHAEMERSFSDRALFKRIPLAMTVAGEPGKPLTLTARDIDGNTASVSSSTLLEPAQKAPLSKESLKPELSSLGGTVFELTDLEVSRSDTPCFIHNREVKELRRAVCAELSHQRRSRGTINIKSCDETGEWLGKRKLSTAPHSTASTLNVLVREFEQLDGLMGLPVSTVYLDFEFGKEYGPALERVRAMGYHAGIATTRIFKPSEQSHLKVIQRLRPDAVLVRNLGALQILRSSGLTLVGDFSLNVTNSLSAEWFFAKGLSRLCPSYDLNGEQLDELLASIDPAKCEVTVHQYIPAFHMEHCVFAAFLSNGSSYRDCGRPCERHRVELRDPKGALHPLKADAECRNTMFNGVPQSAASLIPALLAKGVSTFRIEGLFESPTTLRAKVEAYAKVLFARQDSKEIFTELGLVERYGVTDGQLYNIRSYRDRKKDFVPLSAVSTSADPGIATVWSDMAQGRGGEEA